MSEDGMTSAAVVDMVFPLTGLSLPLDHALELQQALQRILNWLGDDPQTGVHAVKLVPGGEGKALLSQRARLLLRLPRQRVQAATELSGLTLELGGTSVRLGAPHLRELLPHATLYAYAVAAPADDEASFQLMVETELQKMQIRAQQVCGKRHSRWVLGKKITTFSLMLHALTPAHSLRLQEQGLGPHRLQGCGIFVPHKSAAAVGS